jgi:DNA-binding SARP family transcriptional activator
VDDVLRYRILGPLEVYAEEKEIRLSGQRQAALLALLLLDANRLIRTDFLIDRLWGERPPRTVTTSLQNGISQLRRLLGTHVIETRPGGYVMHVAPEQLDLTRFEELVEKARGQTAVERAATLREALALWRGDALADLMFEQGLADARRNLDERRLQALEDRLQSDLEAGRHAEVVTELEALVAEHGSRENSLHHLMLALYQCGRQAEANDRFQAYRTRIYDEAGLLPGPGIQALHRAILRHDPALQPSGARPVHAAASRNPQVVRALMQGRLVAVLGPGVTASSEAAPGPAEAAAHLARVFGCPPERAGGLTKVSQYVAVTHGIPELYDELHGLYAGDYQPGLVHRTLAALPPLLRARGLPHQLLVTTSYDRTLECAFTEAAEQFDVVSYLALGRNRGKFVHIPPDGQARVIDEPNVEVGLTTEERTVILKIHGGSSEQADAGYDSYVVSEDDYIDYLSHTRLSALLPVGLAARLSRSNFLFLGYDLDDWSLRVFLRRLWGEERVGYRSWAVGAAADSVATEYWRQCGVDAFDVEPHEFLEGLRAVLAEDTEAEALA